MVVDADVGGPPAWLATAYVPGPSLFEAINDHGPLSAGSLLTLAAGLAESLSAIHAAGVVHRDLKPSNVLLAEDGPRVIDFGISRAAESTALTQVGQVPRRSLRRETPGHGQGPPCGTPDRGAYRAHPAVLACGGLYCWCRRVHPVELAPRAEQFGRGGTHREQQVHH